MESGRAITTYRLELFWSYFSGDIPRSKRFGNQNIQMPFQQLLHMIVKLGNEFFKHTPNLHNVTFIKGAGKSWSMLREFYVTSGIC